jgi:DNA-directed RNA polymerase subunit RPC12/RpoP
MVEKTWRMMVEPATDELELQPRRSRRAPLEPIDEPLAEARAAERKAARIRFRVYCMACGRSTETAAPPPGRPSRCEHCSGTMLVEQVTT